MKKNKRHITWGTVFLFILLVVIPCGGQEEAVKPPKEPLSPEIEKVKEVETPDKSVEKKAEKEVPAQEEKQNIDKVSESEGKSRKESVSRDSAPVEDEKPARAVPVKEDKPVKEKPAGTIAEKESEPVTKENAAGAERELLSITEGPFKYQRIAGIELKDTASSEQMIADTEQEEEVSNKDGQSTGLFGMDKKTTDVVAWIILGLIILLVFILYRVRARERPGRVLRRFPRV